MITAEEFLKEKVYITQDDVEDVHDSLMSVKEAMIEFAKMHVTEALKQASEKAKVDIIPVLKVYHINREDILNAYPLENIK